MTGSSASDAGVGGAPAVDRAAQGWVGPALLLVVLLMLATRGVPGAVASMSPEVFGDRPYLVPSQALMLYLLLPVAILSAGVVWMAPGLLLVAAFGSARGVASFWLRGFLVALGVQAVVTIVTTTVVPGWVPSSVLLTAMIVVAAGSWGLYYRRGAHGDGGVDAGSSATAAPTGRRVGWLAAVPWLAVVCLIPVIFWLDLNDDGFEALEIGRTLGWFGVPRAPVDELLGLGIGMMPMAYPIRWFQALYGPIEASARLPLILYLPALYSATVLLIEHGARRVLGRWEELAVVAALGVMLFSLVFNASYDPYFADPASPTTFEILTVTLMLGAAWALVAGRVGWFFAFALIGFMGRPSVMPMVAFLGLGAAVFLERRAVTVLKWTILAVVSWFVLGALHGALLERLSGEVLYSGQSIVDRFRYLRFTGWERLRFVLIPCGLVPVLALARLHRLDPVARTLVFAAAAYFALVSVPAFVALHHYAPIMVLPVIVFWRLWVAEAQPRLAVPLVAGVGLVVSAALAAPRSFELNRTFRQVGERVVVQPGDYGSTRYDEHLAALAFEPYMGTLFPYEWNVDDPSRELVVGLQLAYYSRSNAEGLEGADYVFHGVDQPVPPGFTSITVDGGDDIDRAVEAGRALAVAVRDSTIWIDERTAPRRVGYRSRWLEIPRETMFFFFGIPAVNYDLDLSTLPLAWRLFN